MAENKPKFYRFPKTLHLEGSDIVDDDQFVSFLSLKSLIHQKTKLIIQVRKGSRFYFLIFFQNRKKWMVLM